MLELSSCMDQNQAGPRTVEFAVASRSKTRSAVGIDGRIFAIHQRITRAFSIFTPRNSLEVIFIICLISRWDLCGLHGNYSLQGNK